MERRLENIEKGNALILGEIRDLRKEAAEDRRKSEERMERMFRAFEKRTDALEKRTDALEKRTVAFEKRTEALEKHFQESDRRYGDLLRGTAQIGLRILRTLDQHTRLLEGIHRTLHARGNGRNGNGPRRR